MLRYVTAAKIDVSNSFGSIIASNVLVLTSVKFYAIDKIMFGKQNNTCFD